MRARLKVSRAGVELIKSFEGLRQTAARLPDGRWTLGYGHTFSARDGAKVTPEDAEALLRFDLLPIVDGLNNNILVPLNQHQFDALVSFCFNIGLDNFLSSNVLKRINEGRLMEAALGMESWRSAEFGGQTYVLAPLIRRRAAEKNLFLTPVAISDTAPSLLVRPLEDPHGDEPVNATAELDAPVHGGYLSARPLGDPDGRGSYGQTAFAAPQAAPAQPPLTSPYAGSYRPAETPQPAAPVYPQATVAEAARVKPVIVRMAELGAPAVAEDGVPVMSPAVKAALAQAQIEAQSEAQLRAQANAQAEAARLREMQLAEETHRQAQALAAARAQEEVRQQTLRAEEAARQALERERAEAVRLEAEREQARLEQMRNEQARLEAARIEAARSEAARAEAARAEAARVESERLEVERAETARAESARIEALNRVEAERVERERLETLKREQDARAAAQAQPEPSPVTPAPEVKAAPADASTTAEDSKRSEAMANLMRFYSPYAASPMGKPLGPLRPAGGTAPAAPAPAPVAATPMVPAATSPTAEAPRPVYPAFPQAQTPAPVPQTPAAPEPLLAEVTADEKTGLVIETAEPTILSPSALVPPAVFATTPNSASRPEQTVEVPRPMPARPQGAAARELAAEAQANWRDKLARPVPSEFPRAVPAPAEVTPVQAGPAFHSNHTRTAEVVDEDDLAWDDEHERIALMADDEHEDHPSFMAMLGSTIGWLIPSMGGIFALGGAAACYYKSIDSSVVREGYYKFYHDATIVLAALGLVLVCVSITMILRRLGGLKD